MSVSQQRHHNQTGANVEFEINKSLDELVNEDQKMNRHQSQHYSKTNKAPAHQQHHSSDFGGSHHSGRNRSRSAGGRSGGSGRATHQHERGFKSPSSRHEEIGGMGGGGSGKYSQGGRRGGYGERGGHHHQHHRMRDEREVYSSGRGPVEQRDAYGKCVEGKRLFVSNLAFETSWKYLKDHMRQAGDVVRADIFEKPDGTSRGIGLVEFRTRDDARKALTKLHDTKLDGRQIYLKEDTQGHIFPPLQSKKDPFNRPMNDSFGDRGRGHPFGERDSYRGRGSGHPSQSLRGGRYRSRSRSNSPQARGGHYSGARGSSRPDQNRHRNSSRSPPRYQDRGDSRREESSSHHAAARSGRESGLTVQRRGGHNRREASSSDAPQQAFAVHISNLPYTVDRNQLREAFNEFGKILHASVSLDEKGQSRGFGVVEYDSREAAEQSALQMDKASFNGREVTVKVEKLAQKN